MDLTLLFVLNASQPLCINVSQVSVALSNVKLFLCPMLCFHMTPKLLGLFFFPPPCKVTLAQHSASLRRHAFLKGKGALKRCHCHSA